MIRRGDAAVSDIVGTTVLLAVTVLAVGAAAVAFGSLGETSAAAPSIDILANATESTDGYITIKHAGGAALEAAGLEVVVSSSGWTDPLRVPLRMPAGVTTFDLGSTAHLSPLGRPLDAGDAVELLVYLQDASGLVSSASFVVAGVEAPTAPLTGFTIDLQSPASSTSVPAGGTFFVAAAMEHPDGRKSIERVVVDLSEVGGSRAAPLNDEGILGDLTASDGIYSSFLAIPPQAATGDHDVELEAFDLDGRTSDPTSSNAQITITILPSQLSQIETLIAGFNGTNGTSGSNGLNGGAGANGGTVTLAGPQGLPGQNGTAGATGGTGGTGGTGATGPGGTNGTSGTSGTNGTNGTNGTTTVPPLTIPEITSMTPTTGRAGDVITLRGTDLAPVSRLVLAQVGATVGYTASFANDDTVPAGQGIVFAVPDIPEGDYVVTLTRTDLAWASADDLFVVTVSTPSITSVDPPSARAYTQIDVLGTDFNGVTSVSLENPSMGQVAVPWSLIDDGHITFVTHPGLAPGLYDVNVSTGFKWDVEPLSFTSLQPLSPSGLALSPTHGQAGQVLTITGTNLETVSRVTLNQTNGSRIVDAGWYFDSGEIKMQIPIAAAPGGPYTLPYHIDLSGTFVGSVRVPETLTVDPTDGPTLTSFDPKQGEPFTQVNIFGSNFINVKSVTFGPTAVYFTASSPNQILAVTHAGVPVGDHLITVTTATGSVTSTQTFKALPLKIVPLYNRTILGNFGVNLTFTPSDNNAVLNNVTVKAKAMPGWTITGIDITLVEYQFQAGSTPTKSLTKWCGQTAAPDRVSAWTLLNQNVHTFNSLANELDWYFAVKALNATENKVYTTYVITTAQNSNFILSAADDAIMVIDQGFPSNEDFRSCTP